MDDLELIIERALSESPPSVPTVQEVVDRYKKMKASGKRPEDDPNDNRLYEPLRTRTGKYVIGQLEVIHVKSVEFVANMWSETEPFTNRSWYPLRKRKISLTGSMSSPKGSMPAYVTQLEFVGMKWEEKGYHVKRVHGLDWRSSSDTTVNAWRDKKYMKDGPLNTDLCLERWRGLSTIIFYEFKAKNRVRAQILALKCKKGELKEAKKSEDEDAMAFCKYINWNAAKLHIGKDEDYVWVCPIAIRAPMAHSKYEDGVHIEERRLSYKINPGVAGLLKGGFHRTKLEVMQRIISEGLRPGGDGPRGSTMFAPAAPWDQRSWEVVKFKYIPPISVYIYLSGERLCEYDARLSADGHILVHHAIPFTSFDAIWYEDKNGRFHRFMIKEMEMSKSYSPSMEPSPLPQSPSLKT
eukprot:s1948_g2.t1